MRKVNGKRAVCMLIKILGRQSKANETRSQAKELNHFIVQINRWDWRRKNCLRPEVKRECVSTNYVNNYYCRCCTFNYANYWNEWRLWDGDDDGQQRGEVVTLKCSLQALDCWECVVKCLAPVESWLDTWNGSKRIRIWWAETIAVTSSKSFLHFITFLTLLN